MASFTYDKKSAIWNTRRTPSNSEIERALGKDGLFHWSYVHQPVLGWVWRSMVVDEREEKFTSFTAKDFAAFCHADADALEVMDGTTSAVRDHRWIGDHAEQLLVLAFRCGDVGMPVSFPATCDALGGNTDGNALRFDALQISD
jgi:hypothetical protein